MFEKVIFSIVLALACVYSLVLLALLLGLFMAKRSSTKREADDSPFVSVIVPARNEEGSIARCLKSLLNQTYNKDLYEVILVDDNSTDNTLSIASSYAEKDKRLKILRTAGDHTLTGKQRGLDTGIRASKGEIILTTDADCEALPAWIEVTVREFEPDVGLVAGYSLFKNDVYNSILQKTFIRLQYLELLSQYTLSMGSILLGIAWTCTGNNLSYRREVYDELGGYKTLGTTGLEDNMLIQWVDRHTKWKIKASYHSILYTRPMETVSGFFAQRIRWASSSLQYRFSMIAFMIAAYLLNLVLPFLIGFSVFGVFSYSVLIAFLSLKMVPEFLLLLKGLALFKKLRLIKYFPLLQPLHVAYILICGIYGLSGTFAWKGRKYH